ncbi:Myosin type ii heavy chain [Lasiodiplodia theobromae]|uniref:Myosin type ii heavy chain n=1 Tax=Lasiodiplodia theobromae TaxID=45133 RepID=UPI0015C31A10|nr:Myosin type ii heavy chain [Lasiodiplodia theobromae]KAF4537823.1 Myosin type ii heavy chain [Lasiodiplodia theobromae]
MTTINLNININGAAPANLEAPRQLDMAPSHMPVENVGAVRPQPPAPVREFYPCQGTTRKGKACGNVIKHDKWVRGVHFCSHHRGDAAIEELEQLRARVQQLSTDKAVLQSRADTAEESTRRVLSERDEARRERDETQDRAAGELARARGKIEGLTVDIASKERERFNLVVAAHFTTQNARSEREHWTKVIEVLQAENQKLREDQKRTAGELAALSEDKRFLLARITAADGNTARARSERDQARKSLDGSQTQLADAQAKLADSQSKLVSARKTEDELITYSDDLETRIDAAESTTERVSRERDEVRKERDELCRERDELQRSLSEAQDRAASEIARLNEDNRFLLARVAAADNNTARACSERDEERRAKAEVEAQNGELVSALQQRGEEITLAQKTVEEHGEEYLRTVRGIQANMEERLKICRQDLDEDT